MLLKELSEFFIIKIEDKQIVTKVTLVGIPEGRDQAIYKSIIQDKNGFLAYVSFMLSDNYSESCFEQYELANSFWTMPTRRRLSFLPPSMREC